MTDYSKRLDEMEKVHRSDHRGRCDLPEFACVFVELLTIARQLLKENAALKKQLELIKQVATRNIETQEAYLKNYPDDPKIERAKARGAIEAFKVVLE